MQMKLQEFKLSTKAVEAPLRTIVENSGGEGSVVVSKVSEGKDNLVTMLKKVLR